MSCAVCLTDLIIKEKCPSPPGEMLRKYIKLESSQVILLPGSDPGAVIWRLHYNVSQSDINRYNWNCSVLRLMFWLLKTNNSLNYILIFRLLRLHILVHVCQIFSILYEKSRPAADKICSTKVFLIIKSGNGSNKALNPLLKLELSGGHWKLARLKVLVNNLLLITDREQAGYTEAGVGSSCLWTVGARWCITEL